MQSHHGDICKMLDCMKPGARIASYEPLEQVYKTTNLVMPFARVRDGVLLAATTWRGYVSFSLNQFDNAQTVSSV